MMKLVNQLSQQNSLTYLLILGKNAITVFRFCNKIVQNILQIQFLSPLFMDVHKHQVIEPLVCHCCPQIVFEAAESTE